MTDRDDDRRDNDELGDSELEALARRGLSDRGELLPTTEAEVEQAERLLADEQVVLPGKLAEPWRDADPERLPATHRTDPHRARVASADLASATARKRRPWLGYAVAGAIGALAASLAFVWIGRTPRSDGSLISRASDEFVLRRSAPASNDKVHLGAAAPCSSDCCGGSACPNARDDLKACSSGRRCIGCSHDGQVDGAYRIRVGNLALSDDGKRLRDEGTWIHTLELCVRAGSSELVCAPTQPQGTTVAPWTILPRAVSPQNLLAGFELTVREQGKTEPLATWSTPVMVNADVLCRGIAAKPHLPSGATFAVVSVFLEDAYYVELGRSSAVPTLTAARGHFDTSAFTPDLYETTSPNNRRFALVLGPMSQTHAEEIRWQILESGGEASVSVGSDFVGEPKPLP